MSGTGTASAEVQLAHTLAELQERIARDEKFDLELYRGLTNRHWRHTDGAALSLSWRQPKS